MAACNRLNRWIRTRRHSIFTFLTVKLEVTNRNWSRNLKVIQYSPSQYREDGVTNKVFVKKKRNTKKYCILPQRHDTSRERAISRHWPHWANGIRVIIRVYLLGKSSELLWWIKTTKGKNRRLIPFTHTHTETPTHTLKQNKHLYHILQTHTPTLGRTFLVQVPFTFWLPLCMQSGNMTSWFIWLQSRSRTTYHPCVWSANSMWTWSLLCVHYDQACCLWRTRAFGNTVFLDHK